MYNSYTVACRETFFERGYISSEVAEVGIEFKPNKI